MIPKIIKNYLSKIGRKGGKKTHTNQPKGYYSHISNKRWQKEKEKVKDI